MTNILQKKCLIDYKKSDFIPENIDINFTLNPESTIVINKARYIQTTTGKSDLVLDGEDLVLKSIKLNGEAVDVSQYTLTDACLTLHDMQGQFDLEITTEINPSTNTKLDGLYISDNMFCTQCEAEGFRRITYFQDRPDVMTIYTVTMTALKSAYPIMLSNGNRTHYTQTDTHHTATWHDPHKKPCYLFALVAGDLTGIEDTFTTMDGFDVTLKIFTNWGNETRLDYAMDSLKRSMKWDEEKWGRAYDLGVFHIVAVNDFNMGAMENKSLNIFNSRCVLADPDTATDTDYEMIEAIVAHEYFHNWTGNRITCRDWFQLSLKEGLTVFRDQEFSSDERSRSVQRIEDVKGLRNRQFPEDASGLAHPVRPQEVVEINNFYTATVYDKGAEIIRMKHTLLGHDTFYRGADIYFNAYDGQAVTVDEWVESMEKASGRDLTQFKLWYSQAGTPNINIEEIFEDNVYKINVTQSIAPTPGQDKKDAMLIPLSLGLLNTKGQEILATTIYELDKQQQTITLGTYDTKPILSFNRGFSAPITFSGIDCIENTALLFEHDTDTFNRWQAGQDLFTHCIIQHMQGTLDAQSTLTPLYNGIQNILNDNTLDNAYKTHCITMPTLQSIYTHLSTNVDTDKVYDSYKAIKKSIATALSTHFNFIIKSEDLDTPFTPNATDAGLRSITNIAYDYMSKIEMIATLNTRYNKSSNMTTRIHTLNLLCQLDSNATALNDFKERYKDNATVMNKYFSVRMAQPNCDESTISSIANDPLFSMTNPNNARSIYGVLGANAVAFHKADGSMYHALAEGVCILDTINPQTAARLVQPLGGWKNFDTNRADKMKQALKFVLAKDGLSNDVRELANKALIG